MFEYNNIIELEQLFIKNSDEDNAFLMQKYMKGKFSFYGIKTPLRKKITSSFLKNIGYPDLDSAYEISKQFWNKSQREWQYAAIDLLQHYKNKWNKSFLELFTYLIIHKSWWDTVDAIASRIVGPFMLLHPELEKKNVRKWCNSDNLWLQRTSIIYQLNFKELTRKSLLTECILKHKQSNEFFLQKAIGWALRQYARQNPDWVLNFIETNKLKPLSRREAMKHLIV